MPVHQDRRDNERYKAEVEIEVCRPIHAAEDTSAAARDIKAVVQHRVNVGREKAHQKESAEEAKQPGPLKKEGQTDDQFSRRQGKGGNRCKMCQER